ncbi:hypothetical protein J2X31_001848 [Flavobacterium arsenatis]|uniref:C-type lectin domain-containing protein n=1 Tax=Flavobacterium arsenatis TaxID=1484332 RepID=A0ABU1TPD5_9FLAO|nr:T9SS type A sorting domain-containing protein [Flavobacterium arsenatis]MDR6967834.1 hypothetical protein [Flavobacterium arsenatis]
MMKNVLLIIVMTAIFGLENKAVAQCAEGYVFEYNGKSYEIVSQKKTWVEAAACAVAKGGYLAEINNASEQQAIFSEILSLNLNTANTHASDGFGSYVWLGGNDIASEGNWVWNGNNDAVTIPFWTGTASGTLTPGQYSNWGLEPDNWLGAGPAGQDALGMAIINWPNGNAGQWNDVSSTNQLYYVVEYSSSLGVEDVDKNKKISVFPNPVHENIFIQNHTGLKAERIVFINSIGQELKAFSNTDANAENYDVSNFQSGIYFVAFYFEDGTSLIKKIIKK